MSLKLVVTKDASELVEEADRWWREHRLQALNRVEEELAHAFTVLLESPGIGTPYFDEVFAAIGYERRPTFCTTV